MIIAIDGPAAAGKTTLARNLAKRLGILYLDSGATYRTAALVALENGVDLNNEKECATVLEKCKIDLNTSDDNDLQVFLNDRDVTDDIRRNDVSIAASKISVHSSVRKLMVRLQRKIAEDQNIVAEGRDMGSVVFHDADVKIYLDAPLEERVYRRQQDLNNAGQNISFDEVKAEITERDRRDMNRKDSPLICTPDAVYINNGRYTPEDTLNAVLKLIEI